MSFSMSFLPGERNNASSDGVTLRSGFKRVHDNPSGTKSPMRSLKVHQSHECEQLV